MKASTLGRVVTTAAFGATSVYLWRQVDQQRARADAAEQALRNLSAHTPGLQWHAAAQTRLASSNPAVAPRSTPAPALTPETDKPGEAALGERNPWTLQRHEPPPAMKRAMRANLRTYNRRMYADVGDALGLDNDTALKLVDLITDQQFGGFGQHGGDPTEAEKAIADLIGPDKLASWQEYQQSIPARQEFDMLSQQLSGSDMPLTPEQSKQLLDVYVTERARVPMPTFTPGTEGTDYGKAFNAWQSDYAERIGEEASHILNADQLTAYNEIQQWQKDVREQMPGTMLMSSGPRGANVPRANAVYVNGAVMGTAVGAVAVSAPNDKGRKQ